MSIWMKMPALVRGLFGGGVVAFAGTVPWILLTDTNLRHLPNIPWSVPIMLVYLWLLWQFLGGRGWPRIGADVRRISLRANALPPDLWGAAFLSGVAGLVTVVLVQTVMSRIAPMAPEMSVNVPQLSWLTLVLVLPTGALVAGVVEEAAFRGYMQGPIERRHGPVVAILVTGVMFGVAHFSHREMALAWMPYFITVAAVYGTLAYCTNSIMPSLIFHAGGNLLSSLPLLAPSDPNHPPEPQRSVLETGTDFAFWGGIVALAISAAVTIAAFRALATQSRGLREAG